MKVAIVNDTLDEFGGAERVTVNMLHIFPNADFITSFADKRLFNRFATDLTPKIHTFWQGLIRISTHRSLMQVIAPFVWKYVDLSSYDLVLTSACNFMCNLVSVRHGIHIQYIHTIPKSLFGLLPETPLQRLTHYDIFIAPLYRKAMKSTPYVLTSSRHMQQTIFRLFGVKASILPPPIHVPTTVPKRKKPVFYLCVSRLDRDKHLELAVQACTKLNLPLRIVGVTNEPRYEAYLKTIAGPSIQFLGFQSDKEVKKMYKEAIAFLFPSKKEDFGIAPLEALAHGVPVIAYYGGGPKETLKDGITGTFFYTHTVADLIRAIRRLRRMTFDPRKLHAHANTYSEVVFRKRLLSYVRGAAKHELITSLHQ